MQRKKQEKLAQKITFLFSLVIYFYLNLVEPTFSQEISEKIKNETADNFVQMISETLAHEKHYSQNGRMI